MEGTLQPGSPAAAALAAAAEACEEQVLSYLRRDDAVADAGFRNTLVFLLALLHVASERRNLAGVDLRLIRDAARDATVACRAHGVEDLAASLERLAALCP